MWSRGLSSVRGNRIVSRCYSSVSTQTGSVEIDDFLQSISTIATQKSATSPQTLSTAREYFNWLEQNPVKSIDQFIEAAQLVSKIPASEQKKAFSQLDQITNVLPNFLNNKSPNDFATVMRFLLQFTPESRALTEIQKKFLRKNVTVSDLLNTPFSTLVMFIRYSNSSIDTNILDVVADALLFRMEKELVNSADLLAVLAGEGYDKSKWFINKTFIKTVESLVPVIAVSEKCAILKHMAAHNQRNKQLLGAITQSISSTNQCLTVSQIVSITSSCASLTYYPPKMATKVANDLEKNSNILDRWDDVIAIAGSFIRMRMGNEKSWNLIIRWATENVNQAKIEQLSRMVSGLARIGITSGRPLAKTLKPLLKREKVSTASAWLNTVYALAYFQELDPVHADSVLNKNFVEEIMISTKENHDRLRKAMTLLMISSATKVDLKEQYEGPIVDKRTFARYGINFDAKTIIYARQLKYSSDTSECDSFLKSLFKLAPRDTHCKSSSVEECGAFVDAYVMPDQKSGLLVSTAQWNSTKPRPMFFYGFRQTKQNTDSLSSELNVLGQEQLAHRLIRADGYDPVIVFKTELDYCSTDIDKVNLLRKKIHKTN
ncbi:unnamed protein product [Caenorhabditis brenneri]